MNQQIYELTKRYSRNELPDAERAAFEERIANDPAFAAEVAICAAIFRGIQAEGDSRLDDTLRALGKEMMLKEASQTIATNMETPAKRIFQLPRWAYALAAALLLLLIAWPIYQNLKPGQPAYADAATLFKEHFHAPPPPEVRDARIMPWKEAYRNKQYAVSIAELEKLLADPNYTRRSEAQLYLGLSHLASGQAQNALDAFKKVSPDSFDWDEAQWYSALAYFIIDDVVQAKPVLRTIASQPGNSRRKEAQQILDSLE